LDTLEKNKNEYFIIKSDKYQINSFLTRKTINRRLKDLYIGIIDDRISVCRMWSDELGLFVFNVNQKQKIF